MSHQTLTYISTSLFSTDASSTTSSIIDEEEFEEFERTGHLPDTSVPSHVLEETVAQASPSSSSPDTPNASTLPYETGTPTAAVLSTSDVKTDKNSSENKTPNATVGTPSSTTGTPKEETNSTSNSTTEVLDSLLMPPPDSWSVGESPSSGLRPSALSLGLKETIEECMTSTSSSEKSKYFSFHQKEMDNILILPIFEVC